MLSHSFKMFAPSVSFLQAHRGLPPTEATRRGRDRHVPDASPTDAGAGPRRVALPRARTESPTKTPTSARASSLLARWRSSGGQPSGESL